MAGNENSGERLDVRYSQHLQRASGVFGFLVDFFHHGRAVFQWKILQMSRRRRGTLAHNRK